MVHIPAFHLCELRFESYLLAIDLFDYCVLKSFMLIFPLGFFSYILNWAFLLVSYPSCDYTFKVWDRDYLSALYQPCIDWLLPVAGCVVVVFLHSYSFENQWFCSSISDRLAEGMRELEGIKDKPDLVLCTTMALMYSHKRCKTVGRSSKTNLI